MISASLAFIAIFMITTEEKEDDCDCDTKNIDIKKEEEIGTWRSEGNIENSSRRLHNNMWGITDEEKKLGTAKSYIYYKYNGNFGWEWDRPDPTPDINDHVTPIYPEVIIGASGPYSSTAKYFPIKLKDVKSLTSEVAYKYIKTPTGGYNLAYDIWIVDNKGNNKAEVMIWVDGDLGDPQKYVADGINEYGYFYRSPSPKFNWDYHAFVLKNQDPVPLDHKVNIKNLLNILIKSGKLNDDWSVLGVEFGNEVGTGSGRIEISKYMVNINGNNI